MCNIIQSNIESEKVNDKHNDIIDKKKDKRKLKKRLYYINHRSRSDKRKHSTEKHSRSRSRSRDNEYYSKQKKLLNEFISLKIQEEKENKEKMKLPKLQNKSIEEKYQLAGMVHDREDFKKKYLMSLKTCKRITQI